VRIEASRSEPGRSPAVLLFCGIAALLFCIAMSQLWATAHFSPLDQLSRKLEDGGLILGSAIAFYAPKTDEIVAQNYCRYDIVRAGVTTVLADVDRLNRSQDRKAWNSALARADGFLTHAIGCTPTDGNYWARLAMVRWAQGAAPERVAELLSRSVTLAPSEKNILAARFYLWNRVGPKTLTLAKTALQADLNTMLVVAPAWFSASVMRPVGLNLFPYIEEIAGPLPSDRRADLLYFGIALQAPR
jgi:hypothetical protein